MNCSSRPTLSGRQLRILAIWLAAALASRAGAAEPVQPPDFDRDVAPIFVRNCLGCHQGAEPAGGLDLTRSATARKGGESGAPGIVPNQPKASELFVQAAARTMPPAKAGAPLSDADLGLLESWIAAGARWPDDRVVSPFEFTTERRAGLDWWSLRPVVRPETPTPVERDWVRNPIDAFVLAALEKRGLGPAPEADRRTLLRRVKFDLLGLPPTPEEIEAFVADISPSAYERLVDSYLASPHFGERWARHWLDVVRFGESNGYETNTARVNAWPYRDYVIESLNADKPYPQFVLEQLAGDRVGVDAATGFLVGGTHDEVGIKNIEGQLQQRVNDLDDMISTTAAAFFAVTAGCAKCHDHKFDPVSQTDYYSLQAVFAGVQHGERLVPQPGYEQRKAREPIVRAELAAVDAEMAALLSSEEPLAVVPAAGETPAAKRPAVHPRRNSDRFAPVKARFVRFTVLATHASEPCIDELEVYSAGEGSRNLALAASGAKATASSVYANGGLGIHQLAHVNDGQYGNSHSWISAEEGAGWVMVELPEPAVVDRVEWARDREGAFADRLATKYRIDVAAEPGAWRAAATGDDRRPYDPQQPGGGPALDLPECAAVKYRELAATRDRLSGELPEAATRSVYAGTFREPPATHRLYRGEPMQAREPVSPGGIVALGNSWRLDAAAPEAQRRLALARWIGDAANPRTARVLVNRLWHYHFGRGLVSTPSDFGWHGGLPSHPELLDWLASEFVERGWSMKAMHRSMVLSNAYRQASAFNAAAFAVDSDNRLLWRRSPRRLEAEAIRDSVLAVSGQLDLHLGGKGYDPFEPNANYVKVYKPKTAFGPAEWRRMVYESKARMEVDATFGAFDCPDAAASMPKRHASTTALQALNLLNSPFILQQAELFAERLRNECGADAAAQASRGFQLALGRAPDADEAAAASRMIREHGLAALCRALYNANEFIFVD